MNDEEHETMGKRRYAWVPVANVSSQAIHRIGWPKAMSGEEGVALPPAAVVILDETDEGIFLVRYASNGDFAGDTWYKTIQEAERDAQQEFGDVVWQEAPSQPEDLDHLAGDLLASGGSRSHAD